METGVHPPSARTMVKADFVTGLIFVSSSGPDMHAMADTTDVPLNQVPYERLHPGSAGLAKILKRYA